MNVDKRLVEMFGSEAEYVARLGSAIIDAEEKRAFWENIKALKLADESLSIYSLFPVKQSLKLKAAKECCDYVKNLRKPKIEANDD
jgi:hypothetical protein